MNMIGKFANNFLIFRWGPKTSQWSKRNEIRYFLLPQIRFSSEKLLTAVATQGWIDPKNTKDCWTKEYSLEYKNNGTGWMIHKEDAKRRVSNTILYFCLNYLNNKLQTTRSILQQLRSVHRRVMSSIPCQDSLSCRTTHLAL